MKNINFAIYILTFGIVFLTQTQGLLSGSKCFSGPTYWCSNITSAVNCNAVRHCIQTVWEKQEVVADNDSVCKICLDMVKQARDQLESNETQNDIKEVFEGSCKLIPLKPVRKECMKFVDNFAPELVEALASQMDPQVVCSVAGLCNNEKIDIMLEEFTKITEKTLSLNSEEISQKNNLITCNNCSKIGSYIIKKFENTSSDEILENMLQLCGLFSSYSDACSNIVISYFDSIYSRIKKEISIKNICYFSGDCAANYHQHEEKPDSIDIRPMSSTGVLSHTNSEIEDDDLPCQLCEQLIRHMKDVLIANTTESEFKQVLEGLCKQTKEFKNECLNIVDQYYDIIYNTLINNLDPNGACFLIGVCKKGTASNTKNLPIAPLIPTSLASKYQVSTNKYKKNDDVNEPIYSNDEIQQMQLPNDILMNTQNVLVNGNGELCTICEYFLHFVQEALATPANEDKIKEIVSSTCNKLPSALVNECRNFVNLYGDAIIALLIQDIDPSQICPKLKLCPENIHNKEITTPKTNQINSAIQNSKPTCSLCLFAVFQARQMIKNDKTKNHIQEVLDNLCTHMNKKLKDECIVFVKTYSDILVDKLVNDFTPQEICEYLKLCGEPKANANIIFDEMQHQIETNNIIEVTSNNYNHYDISKIECSLCKEIIQKTENKIINTNKTKDIIYDALEESCEIIPQIKNKCKNYVKKYGDMVVKLILEDVPSEEICRQISLCSSENDMFNVQVIAEPASHEIKTLSKDLNNSQQCVLCEFVMAKLENELKNKKTQEEIKNAVYKICKTLPKTVAQNCNNFIDKYGDLIITLLDTLPPKEICVRINLCSSQQFHIDANEEIIKCGVCHGAVLNLYPLIKENPNISEDDLIYKGCNEIPAKYYAKCSDLVAYYGESISNLIKKDLDFSTICQNIGKCFINENSTNSYIQIGGNIDSDRRKRSTNSTNLIVGANKCTWGPSYWCETGNQADECNARKWCVEKKVGFAA